jgi:hemolysin activation/secretion protein
MNKHLIDRENFDLIINLGFDSKHITNYQSQNVSSKDRLSIVKTGFDIDSTDEHGRTVFIYELDYGIPDFLGSLDKKDPIASRSGAGGKFVKNNINLLRLQKLPFSSHLLWKNQFQLSPYVLSAAEQYQVGGVVNVRGYPPAEVVGDKGYAMTFEWSIPPYFVSKDIKVPHSRAKLYDALRIVMFYDWGHVHLKRPTSTEQDDRTLRSAGCGLRFNLPEDFSVRVEFAWPLDNTPSDSDHMHTWAQVSKEF